MHNHDSVGASSLSSIIAVAASALLALVILFVFILPAEFGSDPTGIGEQIGVNNMSVEQAQADENSAGAQAAVAAGLNPDNIVDNSNDEDRIEGAGHINFARPMQFVELEIPVPADGQLEYKFVLEEGSQINYHWAVNDGKLAYSDLHGHTPAPEGSEEDEIVVKYLDSQEDQNVSGQFIAPFTGDHGWFFLNLQSEDITITLKASGYWESHELLPIESYY